eukprot:scaffold12995_cov64-Cylindrotheca_fusiformis.AAC.1
MECLPNKLFVRLPIHSKVHPKVHNSYWPIDDLDVVDDVEHHHSTHSYDLEYGIFCICVLVEGVDFLESSAFVVVGLRERSSFWDNNLRWYCNTGIGLLLV